MQRRITTTPGERVGTDKRLLCHLRPSAKARSVNCDPSHSMSRSTPSRWLWRTWSLMGGHETSFTLLPKTTLYMQSMRRRAPSCEHDHWERLCRRTCWESRGLVFEQAAAIMVLSLESTLHL